MVPQEGVAKGQGDLFRLRRSVEMSPMQPMTGSSVSPPDAAF